MSTENKAVLQEGKVRLIRNTIARIPVPLLMALSTYPASVFLSSIPTEDYKIYGSLIGAIFYAVGTDVDNESTIFAFASINRFERLTGIRSPIVETNTDLPARPTEKDMYSLQKRLNDAAVCVGSILIPPIGVAIGGLRLLCGFNNLLEKRFHDKELAKLLSTPKVP